MRRWGSVIVFLLCVVFSGAALYNVMSDNSETEKLAAEVACDNAPMCAKQKTFMERTPFSQSFTFALKKGSVDVKCTRSLVIFGEYACVKK